MARGHSPAFQRAVLATPKGATLYFPPGTYTCKTANNGKAVFDFSSAAICNNAVTIAGDGIGSTTFSLDPAFPNDADFILRAGNAQVSGTTFRDFTVVPASTVVGQHGIHINALVSNSYYEINC